MTNFYMLPKMLMAAAAQWEPGVAPMRLPGGSSRRQWIVALTWQMRQAAARRRLRGGENLKCTGGGGSSARAGRTCNARAKQRAVYLREKGC